MTSARTPAQEVFAHTTLSTDEQVYRLIQLPAPAITAAASVLAEIGAPFSALIADKNEVTLLLSQEEWDTFSARLPGIEEGGLYRLITFDAALDPSLTGFLALVCDVLASAQVPILALSAFTRDHILVPADRFDTAWAALRTAQQSGSAA